MSLRVRFWENVIPSLKPLRSSLKSSVDSLHVRFKHNSSPGFQVVDVESQVFKYEIQVKSQITACEILRELDPKS